MPKRTTPSPFLWHPTVHHMSCQFSPKQFILSNISVLLYHILTFETMTVPYKKAPENINNRNECKNRLRKGTLPMRMPFLSRIILFQFLG